MTLIGLLTVNAVAADSAPPTKLVPVITISNFQYTGALTVRPGQTVKVTNADGTNHTFSNPKNKFDTGTIAPGTSKKFVAPRRVGNYKVICHFHSFMAGTLHVVAP
jgi:plastocyanin